VSDIFKNAYAYKIQRPRSTGDDLEMHCVGTTFTMKINSNDTVIMKIFLTIGIVYY
jgi:hypothetical protein